MKRIYTVLCALGVFGTALADTAAPAKVTATAVEQQIDELTQKAEQGDAAAQYALGRIYLDTEIVPMQEPLAFKYFQAAAAQRYAPAMTALGYCYEIAIETDRDYEKAVELYQAAAELGDVPAFYHLGICYKEGYGVQADADKAEDYFLTGALHGNISAAYELACCYEQKGDMQQAASWYAKAAQGGDWRAQNRYGECCEYGLGVQQDIPQAISWYRAAAGENWKKALYNLGRCHMNGIGVPANKEEGIRYYLLACPNEHAHLALGLCYETGDGVPLDLAKAILYYRYAANFGLVTAQYRLAGLYAKEGAVAEAAEMYRMAADNGSAEAQTYMGWCCYHTGDESMYPAAFKWFKEAEKSGYAPALYALGFCYENSVGTYGNMMKARNYYQKAADAGDANALYRLAEAHEYGELRFKRDKEKAQELYKAAADKGHWKAVIRVRR